MSRYTLSKLKKALIDAKAMYKELIYVHRLLSYHIMYRNWIDDLDKKEHAIYSCGEETKFIIGYENIDILPDHFGNHVGEYSPTTRLVYRINCGYLHGPRAIPLTSNYQPFSTRTTDKMESIRTKKHHILDNQFSYLNFLELLPIRTSPSLELSLVFPLVGLWDTNYYHWVSEYLPKLRGLNKYENSAGNQPKILLTSEPPDWQFEWLELLGINKERICAWNDEKAKVDTLVLTDHRLQTGGKHGQNYDLSIDDIYWVRNSALSNISNSPNLSNKIYISRQKTRRRVSNFDEIKIVLNNYNYDIYRLEELSVEDQISLFSTTETVVGPHGSGLTNIIFAPENLRLIELLPKADAYPHYFRLTQMLSQDYYYILSDDSKSSEFCINTDRLSNILEVI